MSNTTNEQKKYASLTTLQTFLNNLKTSFAHKAHTHTVSDIENIKDIMDVAVDTELSSTSVNPVANSVLNAEFDAISDAMGALEIAIDGKAETAHSHDDRYYTETEIDTKLDGKADASHTHSNYVSTSRTINGKALSSNITLSASDVGALPSTTAIPSIEGLATETYVDEAVSTKADKTHNHDSSYDAKGSASAVQENLDAVSDAIDAHTANTDIHVTTTNKSNWNTAYTHSTSAHARTDATKVADSTTNGNILINGTETNVYSHPNSGVTAGTYKSVTVNAQGHITSGTNPTTLAGYGITDAETKGAASSALADAKTYADSVATTAANKVKNDLLNGAGTAYDTLKELGDLITDNQDAIDALETVAAGKANASHTHGNITNAGAIGTASGKAVVTTTNGVLTTGTVPVASGGTGATTAAGALTNLGLTATAAELNKLDGVTATTAELNYVDGVTSNIQTQLDGKAATSHNHAASNITSGTLSSDRLPTVPATKGGTGQTSLINSANALINALGAGDSDPVDTSCVITQGVGDYSDKFYRKPISYIWNYIKSKADSIYAAKSHGTHVSYSTTAPVMDGTASVGSASTVARSDHKHPTDTSRAAKTDLDSHTSNTTAHITSTERSNWNAAKTHADSAHVTGVKGNSESTYRTGNVNITPANIGLGNVNNTSDANKPISTAQQAALDAKVPTSRTVNGKALSSNISITKADVGLGNVDNTADSDKNVNGAKCLVANSALTSVEDMDNFISGSALKYATFKLDEDSYGLGFGSNDGMLLSIPWGSSNYGAQIAFDDIGASNIAVRGKANTWGSWHKLIHSGNIGSQSVATATKATQDASGNTISSTYATKSELNTAKTDLQTQLDTKQATITGGASTITGSDLTANRALISNSSGKVAVSDITSTELGYLDGVTSNIQTQLNGKENVISWTAVAQGLTWSRICLVKANTSIVGWSGILSVGFTRGNVVGNATFAINASHSSTVHITQLNANKYTTFQIRGVTDSNVTNTYIEIYDNVNGIASGTNQTMYCKFIPLLGCSVTKYTSFTSGATIPSGYTAGTALTVDVSGGSMVASKFVGNLSGNATTATKASGVADYNGTSRTIKIGYQGDSLSTSEIGYIAGYNTNGTQIKDVSKATLQSWLELNSTYATKSELNSVSALVGNKSVSEQINEAIAALTNLAEVRF